MACYVSYVILLDVLASSAVTFETSIINAQINGIPQYVAWFLLFFMADVDGQLFVQKSFICISEVQIMY